MKQSHHKRRRKNPFLTTSNILITTSVHSPLRHFRPNQYYRHDILDIVLVRVPFFTQIYNLNKLFSDRFCLRPCLSSTLSSPPQIVSNRLINGKKYIKILSNLPTIINLTTNDQYIIVALMKTSPNSSNIYQEIAGLNRLHRKWQRNRNPTIKRRLNANISFIRTIL